MYRQVPEQRRRRPQARQHRDRPPRRHAALVAERIGDGDVPVDADAAQVEQRRRGEEHVVGVEDVAHDGTERPASGDLLERVEGHDQDGHEEISDGQRDEERVGDDSESFEAQRADDDQHVTADCRDDDRGHRNRFEQRRRHFVGARRRQWHDAQRLIVSPGEVQVGPVVVQRLVRPRHDPSSGSELQTPGSDENCT